MHLVLLIIIIIRDLRVELSTDLKKVIVYMRFGFTVLGTGFAFPSLKMKSDCWP